MYTKGEWVTIHYPLHTELAYMNDDLTATVFADVTGFDHQNIAGFIAAAPDLYEACKFTVAQIDAWRRMLKLDRGFSEMVLSGLEKALAKAEGK